MRRQKKKTWQELKSEKCPKCREPLMSDMFTGEVLGCKCGFIITKSTKDLLVNRDHKEI